MFHAFTSSNRKKKIYSLFNLFLTPTDYIVLENNITKTKTNKFSGTELACVETSCKSHVLHCTRAMVMSHNQSTLSPKQLVRLITPVSYENADLNLIKMARWVEVSKVIEENRHELVLSGDVISSRISESGLDDRVFEITALNFLEISKCGLTTLSDQVGQMINLTSLVLHGNKLTILPDAVGSLHKLKHLDVSNNELASFPDTISQLRELQTLNASCNKLDSFIFAGVSEIRIFCKKTISRMNRFHIVILGNLYYFRNI